jgi:hypothetical protein
MTEQEQPEAHENDQHFPTLWFNYLESSPGPDKELPIIEPQLIRNLSISY